ncbi:mechanosensitive ion channel family protein [Halococcus sp. PRR34]|uniref:mechanosensitive ion channel family protein n=1 Tax=Halococcus sp. PRR34 TaxID=3020830 RepID=UPI00235F6DE9|nr:mechanosensitive ion channel family protein [Halococcus sp. PRR34]
MNPRLSAWFLQSGTQTPNGTGANVSEVISNPKVGPVGEFLHSLNIPYYKILGAMITFVIAVFVLYSLGRAFVVPFVSRLLNRRGLDAHEKKPLLRLTKLLVTFVSIGIAFRVAGYTGLLTSLAAIGAAATLAIGFALQDTLSNFVAGVFIYTDRPFRIGDWIEWDGGSYAGTVEDISFRVTRVRTFDNELLTVPNSVLTGGVIKNPVEKDELRLQFTFGIGYDDDIETATDIIIEEAENHPDILDDPAPTVRMSTDGALADSYVGLTSRFWIADPNRADFLETRGEYVTNVKQRFDEAGIDIPYPQVDLSGGMGIENPQRFPQSVE